MNCVAPTTFGFLHENRKTGVHFLPLQFIKRPYHRQRAHQRQGVLLERIGDVVPVDDMRRIHVLGLAGDGAERREERLDPVRDPATRLMATEPPSFPSAAYLAAIWPTSRASLASTLADKAGEAALQIAEGVGPHAQLLAAGVGQLFGDQARRDNRPARRCRRAGCCRGRLARGWRSSPRPRSCRRAGSTPSLTAIRQRPCFV